MRRRGSAGLILTVAAAWNIAGCASIPVPNAGGQAALPPAAADHHLHIQGPEVTGELLRLAAKSPEIFKNMDSALIETRTGADALKALDEAGIEKGVLLSEAYMFASRFADFPREDVARLTRTENQANVQAAQNSEGRLLAFVGVNPLADGASEELAFWARQPHVSGVKFQLGNAGFDPKNPTHVAKLAAFFDAARNARMPIVAHVRSTAEYGADEARIFINRVLPHAGDLPIQIAHAGGFGRLDEATIAALSAYADALARQAPGTRNLVLDLALVIVDDKTDPALAERFAQAMRRAGLNRFVVGSDWPSRFRPSRHNELMTSQLPLTRAEWLVVLANKAPYFEHRRPVPLGTEMSR